MFVRNRKAFTLVELLVVIAIIGMLMGLVLPAVNSARERARSGICLSNMRQVGLAIQNYESRSSGSSYPGYKLFLRMGDGTGFTAPTFSGCPYPSSDQGSQVAVSWLVELFPYMDQQRLYDAWKKSGGTAGGGSSSGGSSGGSTAGATASQATAGGGGGSGGSSGSGGTNFSAQFLFPFIDLVVCPSDPPSSLDRAPLSIVVNAGMKDGSTAGARDFRENGVFHDHYTDNPLNKKNTSTTKVITQVSSAFIDRRGDGLQYTLLLAENVDAGSYLDHDERFLGFTWSPVQGTVDFSVKPPSGMPQANVRRINEDIGKIASPIEDPSFSSGGGTGAGGGSGSSSGGPGATASQATGGGGGGGGGGGSSGGSGAYSSLEDSSAKYYYYARPSANHPNGVNVVFTDGHGVFMSDRIDYYVYTMLMTPQGSGVKDPQTGQPINQAGYAGTPTPPPFDEAWIKQ